MSNDNRKQLFARLKELDDKHRAKVLTERKTWNEHTRHRHLVASGFKTFVEHVNALINDEAQKYQWCTICGCFPEGLTGKGAPWPGGSGYGGANEKP